MIEHEKALYSISCIGRCECGGRLIKYSFSFPEWDYTKCDKCGKTIGKNNVKK